MHLRLRHNDSGSLTTTILRPHPTPSPTTPRTRGDTRRHGYCSSLPKLVLFIGNSTALCWCSELLEVSAVSCPVIGSRYTFGSLVGEYESLCVESRYRGQVEPINALCSAVGGASPPPFPYPPYPPGAGSIRHKLE